MDVETEFLTGLLELGYGEPVEEKLKLLAPKIFWARGWPEDKKAFWNAEAFMWGHKIGREARVLLTRELSFLRSGRNLDLGCGAHSYVPSVGLDFSEKMLQYNDQCPEKILGDLEQPLPFDDSQFDSVTLVFVLNYIKNYRALLQEVQRVLRPEGKCIAVLSAPGINSWQRQKEVNAFSPSTWQDILHSCGFKGEWQEKKSLYFFSYE